MGQGCNTFDHRTTESFRLEKAFEIMQTIFTLRFLLKQTVASPLGRWWNKESARQLSITSSYSAGVGRVNKSISEFLHLERKVLLQVQVFLSVVLHRHTFQSNQKHYCVLMKLSQNLCGLPERTHPLERFIHGGEHTQILRELWVVFQQ